MSDFWQYLYQLRNRGSTFGIERMQVLAERLGNPQLSFPSIHVAGTNGKGSVCSILASIYQANGYKVGLFTSPHLVDLGERVRVNGALMPEEEIKRTISSIRPIAEKMEREREGMHPTFFEFMTAVAFLRFAEEKVDLAILETGLGGRLDSTNVVVPELSIITSISLDHCEILGSCIADIAREKAGIIKPNAPVLSGWLPQQARKEIELIAKQRKAEIKYLDHGIEKCPQTNLSGSFQRRNAALAREAVSLLSSKFPTNADREAEGLMKVSLPGRWQILREDPKIILDACHNSGGLECLLENLEKIRTPKTLWIAAMGRERAEEIIPVLAARFEKLVFFTPDLPRACEFSEMLELTPPAFRSKVSRGDWQKIEQSLQATLEESNEDLLVTGSIYLIGRVLSVYRRKKSKASSSLQDLF